MCILGLADYIETAAAVATRHIAAAGDAIPAARVLPPDIAHQGRKSAEVETASVLQQWEIDNFLVPGATIGCIH